MFNNIGGKIKGLAKFVCWLGIIGSSIWGVFVMWETSQTTGDWTGFVIGSLIILMFFGCVGWFFGIIWFWTIN